MNRAEAPTQGRRWALALRHVLYLVSNVINQPEYEAVQTSPI